MRLPSAATLVVLVILLLLAFAVGRGTRTGTDQDEFAQVDSTGEQGLPPRRNANRGRSGRSGRVGPRPRPQTACGGTGVGGGSRYYCPGGESAEQQQTESRTRLPAPEKRTP